MNLRKPISPLLRGVLAVVFIACLPVGRSGAQPADPPAPVMVDKNQGAATNLAPPQLATSTNNTDFSQPTAQQTHDFTLANARYLAKTCEWKEAEKNYLKLLTEDEPVAIQKTVLIEMAQVVHAENDLPRAQAIYTQYLTRWPGDIRAPEIFLKQGQIFREMDLPNLALTKFYGVMTTALSIKESQLEDYETLVLQAQVEIAETHYIMGKFKDAADYYSRLLTQNNPSLDRPQIQFRLIRSLEAIDRHDDAAAQALDFLSHFANSPEEPEVRYHLARAYKSQKRNTEALQQVTLFLKEESAKTTNNPAAWSYWQQRVGNEIGNELYQEGDYVKALEVYLTLAQLNPAPSWQLPVRYQVGLTYERLLQPRLAEEAYRALLTNAATAATTNLAPDLKSVVDMAGWRLRFLEWNEQAADFTSQTVAVANTNSPNNPSHQP
jgi:tetratricopeptide (TPR) repeat protein